MSALLAPDEVAAPANYLPRWYQVPLFEAFQSGVRRFVQVWHRRAGKDKTDFCLMVREAATGRVGNYYYVFPTYSQGKKALWENIDRDGFRVIEHCPRRLLTKDPNESDMSLDFRSGSTLQIVGSVNPDALRGPNPCGVVFSEYAEQSPMAWQVIKPILIENRGWAAFNFTPKGQNHAYDLYTAAVTDPDWYASLLTVDDTDALDAGQKAEARKGSSAEFYAQEYLCDFTAANQGAYYGRVMAEALAQGRIGLVPYDPTLKVHTIMDIGVSDDTSIGFVQVKGNAVFCIDYYANHSEGFDHYARILDEKRERLKYRYGVHVAPHDAGQRSKNDAVTYADHAKTYGYRLTILPLAGFEAGVELVRMLLPRCYFSRDPTQPWVAALRAYTKKYNEVLQVWSDTPQHDWASHPADMTRYLAQAEKAGLLSDARGGYARPATTDAAGWVRG